MTTDPSPKPPPLQLHTHSTDDSRSYQVGYGQLTIYNTEAGQQQRLPVPSMEQWPNLEELTAESLGAHPFRATPPSESHQIVTYVRRDCDPKIERAMKHVLSEGGLLLLLGDSAVGKSRSAYEAARRLAAEYQVLNPSLRADLMRLPIHELSNIKCILWLDDLDNFIDAGAVDVRLLDALTAAGVPMVATMRDTRYGYYKASTHRVKPNFDLMRVSGEQIVRRARTVYVDRLWSGEERERGLRSSDPRISHSATKCSEQFGLSEYLAAGPEILHEWRSAARARANPRGHALVAAAVDLTRVGLGPELNQDLIVEAHHYYLGKLGGSVLRPESLEEALDWASDIRYGATSLLIPGASANSWRAFEYLVDSMAKENTASSIPDETWEAALRVNDDVDLLRVGIAGAENHRRDVAERAWVKLAHAGMGSAAFNLGVLNCQSNNFEAALEWHSKAFALDVPAAALHSYLIINESNGPEELAMAWLKKAVEAGDATAMGILAQRHARNSETEIAVSLHERAIEGGNLRSYAQLGMLYSQRQDHRRALALFETGAQLGDAGSAALLGWEWANRMKFGLAGYWWDIAAKLDDWHPPGDGPSKILDIWRDLSRQMTESARSLDIAIEALASSDANAGQSAVIDESVEFMANARKTLFEYIAVIDAGFEQVAPELSSALLKKLRSRPPRDL